MKPTVIEDQIFEFETSGGNESSVLIAAESSWRGMKCLCIKEKKEISVMRKSLDDVNFFRTFIRRYIK